ncbi:hypothetical protein ACHQM5_010479 [Ranunculus cassubicifolius]
MIPTNKPHFPIIFNSHIKLDAKMDENGALQERFNDLAQDWESLKQSNPPRRLNSRKYHTEMKPKSVSILKARNSSSPKQLTSSYPSLEGEWKVRTNDLAMAEIYEERKAKRESSGFKARKLLDEFENMDLYNDGDNGDGENEECVSDCLSRGSSISVKKMENVKGSGEEKKVAEVVNGGNISESGSDQLNDGGRWMGLMFLFAFVLGIFALGIISSFCYFDGFPDEDVEIMFPT